MTAAITGIIGAIVTASKTIRDRFMDDVKHAPDVEPTIRKHAADLAKNRFDVSGKSFNEWARVSREKKHENAEIISKLIEKKWGIGDGFVIDTVKRFKVLSDRSRKVIAFSGGVGAVLGAAMALSFFNGVATRDRIEKIEDALTKNNER